MASGSLSEESVAKDKEYHKDREQGNEGTRRHGSEINYQEERSVYGRGQCASTVVPMPPRRRNFASDWDRWRMVGLQTFRLATSAPEGPTVRAFFIESYTESAEIVVLYCRAGVYVISKPHGAAEASARDADNWERTGRNLVPDDEDPVSERGFRA